MPRGLAAKRPSGRKSSGFDPVACEAERAQVCQPPVRPAFHDRPDVIRVPFGCHEPARGTASVVACEYELARVPGVRPELPFMHATCAWLEHDPAAREPRARGRAERAVPGNRGSAVPASARSGSNEPPGLGVQARIGRSVHRSSPIETSTDTFAGPVLSEHVWRLGSNEYVQPARSSARMSAFMRAVNSANAWWAVR